ETRPRRGASLSLAATTGRTNGTGMTEALADALARLAHWSRYSLEIRLSLDAADAEANDRVRGRGTWERATRTLRLLDARGLLPIVSATEIAEGAATYDRFRALLSALGIAKPRVKILPVFPVGRAVGAPGVRLTDADLEGFDRSTLPCAETRAVAADGVYACPILAGLPGARLSDGALAAALGPAALYHASCPATTTRRWRRPPPTATAATPTRATTTTRASAMPTRSRTPRRPTAPGWPRCRATSGSRSGRTASSCVTARRAGSTSSSGSRRRRTGCCAACSPSTRPTCCSARTPGSSGAARW